VVVMGDMNSHLSDLLNDSPLSDSGLCPAANVGPTYPAWRPLIALDHVLTTPALAIKSYTVLDHDMSDHRPIAVTIGLQDWVWLARFTYSVPWVVLSRHPLGAKRRLRGGRA